MLSSYVVLGYALSKLFILNLLYFEFILNFEMDFKVGRPWNTENVLSATMVVRQATFSNFTRSRMAKTIIF